MIPESYEHAPCPVSERKVFDTLKQRLSDGWYVFHSLAYFGRDHRNQRWDGEIDFLLFRPGLGILVLEVKGGEIAFHDGRWWQDGVAVDPFGQARRNKHAIRKFLQDVLKRPIPMKFAHAVCFPICDFKFPAPPEAQGAIIDRAHLGAIEAFATQLIEETQLPPNIFGEPPDAADIVRALSPEFEFAYPLSERIRADETLMLRLTDEQCVLLDAMRDFKRLSVCGCAGSGKTIMAVKKAIALSENGQRVLLLCYNRLLAKRLRRATETYPNIEAAAFFDYCVDALRISDEEIAKYSQNPDLYAKALPHLLLQHIERTFLNYDAVIVDEGQDFSPEAWKAIRALLVEDGVFYVFYDPDQNIFSNKTAIPDFGMPPIYLSRNCRNTRKIFQELEPYISIKAEPHKYAPVGADVRTRNGNCLENLECEIRRLRTDERVQPSDIVILGAHAIEHTPLNGRSEICGIPLTAGESRKSSEIAYYTYMKFKGCESKVVILFGVDGTDTRWQSRCGLYAAMSRASHHLVILRR